MMSTIWSDIKYACRMLRKSPGFTIVAVVSLALSIGANTAVFSLLNSILLHSLPVQDAQALCVLTWTAPPLRGTNFWYGEPADTPGGGMTANVFTYPGYEQLRQQVAGQAELFAFTDFTTSDMLPLTVVAEGQVSTARGLMVSDNFFAGLGLTALLGQTLTSEHNRPEAEPVTVISYAAWQQVFNGDNQVLGRTVTLNNQSYQVIGVLPPSFQGVIAGVRHDYYVPFSQQPQMCPMCSLTADNLFWVQIMARLDPEADESQIEASLNVLFARSVQGAIADNIDNTAHIVMEDGRGGPLTPRVTLAKSLWLLLGLVGLLLLVTCVNLAGLMLARGLKRQHEMAVRTTLGAGRGRLIRQHLVESLLIALAGVTGGFVIAVWGKAILMRLLWSSKVMLDSSMDMRVFCFAVGLSMATALVAALVPAWRSTHSSVITVLRERSGAGFSRQRWGRVLVAVQMGLSLLVLAGAGLFARTLINLYRIDTGFQGRNLLVFRLNATQAGYQGPALIDFYEQVRSSLEALPEIKAAVNSNYQLLSGERMSSSTVCVTRGDLAQMSLRVKKLHISDSYLSTLGIPLRQGRHFRDTDSENKAKVVIVNETLARTMFPNEDPVGQYLPWDQEDFQIVGVCADIKDIDLKQSAEPTVFYPYNWLPSHVPPILIWSHYAVQTTQDPLSLVPAVRKVVAELDPTVPLTGVKTQAIQLDQSIARERCLAGLSLSLALLVVGLSCMGLYSIMVYHVTSRFNEIGLRMALGATTRHVSWTVLRSALLVVGAGIALGVPVFLATVRIIRSTLFGIGPYDPVTLTGAIVLLLVVAMLAVWIPARRAAKIDPMEALRYE